MRILITGGAGYIGTHTLVEALVAGHDICVLDNFANSSPVALERAGQIAGRAFRSARISLCDGPRVDALVRSFRPEAAIHFAGLKAVGESVLSPLDYYAVNVGGTLQLLAALRRSGCRRLVFSSSATVYGAPDYVPIDEAHPCRVTSPYGRSKLQVEEILGDLSASDPSWSIALLRYFNPVGAHDSGMIGEDPLGVPNNLMPFVAQVAVGRRSSLRVFGTDYPTPDGTGVRDYLHVSDLARAHLRAVDWVSAERGCEAFNLGTGRGRSVLELVDAFSRASGRRVPIEIAPRRPGDVAICHADPGKARRVLGWQAELSLQDMCASAWRWQSRNPDGYVGSRPTRLRSATAV